MNNTQKVIPRDIWKEFDEYWTKIEYEKLSATEIRKHLGDGKYLFVPLPKEITKPLEAKIWYMRISEHKEKGKPSNKISFKDNKTTLEEVFGIEPLSKSEIVDKVRNYIKSIKMEK
jgi:predicted nucleotidyltransferase